MGLRFWVGWRPFALLAVAAPVLEERERALLFLDRWCVALPLLGNWLRGGAGGGKTRVHLDGALEVRAEPPELTGIAVAANEPLVNLIKGGRAERGRATAS